MVLMRCIGSSLCIVCLCVWLHLLRNKLYINEFKLPAHVNDCNVPSYSSNRYPPTLTQMSQLSSIDLYSKFL